MLLCWLMFKEVYQSDRPDITVMVNTKLLMYLPFRIRIFIVPEQVYKKICLMVHSKSRINDRLIFYHSNKDLCLTFSLPVHFFCRHSEPFLFSSVTIDNEGIGWAVDVLGQIWFTDAISPSNPAGSGHWWQVGALSLYWWQVGVLSLYWWQVGVLSLYWWQMGILSLYWWQVSVLSLYWWQVGVLFCVLWQVGVLGIGGKWVFFLFWW